MGGIPNWLMKITQLHRSSLEGDQLDGPITSFRISRHTNLERLSLFDNRDLNGNFDAFLMLSLLKQLKISCVKLIFLSKYANNELVPVLNMLELHSCNVTEFSSKTNFQLKQYHIVHKTLTYLL